MLPTVVTPAFHASKGSENGAPVSTAVPRMTRRSAVVGTTTRDAPRMDQARTGMARILFVRRIGHSEGAEHLGKTRILTASCVVAEHLAICLVADLGIGAGDAAVRHPAHEVADRGG